MAAWDSSICRFSEKCQSMYSTFPLHPLRRQGDLSTARVGLIDRSVVCRLQVIRLQAEILLRRRNPRIADDHPPPASRWSKETRGNGFFEMESLSNRRCKESPH